MDLIDMKLLCNLDVDCRQPISKLASNLRIGRNVAAYRIANLEKEGIITKYICSINLGSLGFKTYKIYFMLQHSLQGLEPKFVEYLIKDKRVVNLLKTEGSGAIDYSVTIAVNNIAGFENFLMELKNEFKGFISDYLFSLVVYTKVFRLEKLLLGKASEVIKFERYAEETGQVEIDDKDKEILKFLSQNSNASIVEISKKLKLSIDIVKYRLKKLNESVINTNRALISLAKLGFYHYVIMIKARSANKEDESQLLSWCAKKENIMHCTKRIGNFDFEVNAAIKDIDSLNDLLEELRSKFASIIEDYELSIISKVLKINYVPY